jgi:acetyl-CoA synthetase
MATLHAGAAASRLRAARDFLINHREDYATAYRDYRPPALTEFNWALDWFDAIAADGGDRPALWIVAPDGGETRRTFAELSACSNQVANWLREHGVARGDRVIVMLGNQVELWETILAAMKLGAVIIPATPLLGPAELVDRVKRGDARHVVVPSAHATKFDDVPGAYTRIVVGEPIDGWLSYADSGGADTSFAPDAVTMASDPLLLYFTSGTTAKPKLVEHTHASYPVGHLSTMYWIGLQPGDVHLNVSSPGWAKHAWSNVYAPWLAEACVMLFNFARFDAPALLDQMVRCQVSTFCAPPTVWRMLIQQTSAAGRCRCARRSLPASRSTPRLSSKFAATGTSRYATATARPRRQRRSATRPASRSSPARWGARCPVTSSRCSTRSAASRPRRGRSRSASPNVRSG